MIEISLIVYSNAKYVRPVSCVRRQVVRSDSRNLLLLPRLRSAGLHPDAPPRRPPVTLNK